MSMIGNRLLNDIINGQGIESSAQILEELEKHQGTEDQLDDITMVGVKV